MIDIKNIEWEEAPANFDQTGTLAFVQTYTADPDQNYPDLVLAYDMNAQKSGLVLSLDGKYYDSMSTADWGVLDRELGGREAWKAVIADHNESSELELEA
ncbi:hypothetical protein ACQX06_09645 [Corynebacterium diphtheriae]